MWDLSQANFDIELKPSRDTALALALVLSLGAAAVDLVNELVLYVGGGVGAR